MRGSYRRIQRTIDLFCFFKLNEGHTTSQRGQKYRAFPLTWRQERVFLLADVAAEPCKSAPSSLAQEGFLSAERKVAKHKDKGKKRAMEEEAGTRSSGNRPGRLSKPKVRRGKGSAARRAKRRREGHEVRRVDLMKWADDAMARATSGSVRDLRTGQLPSPYTHSLTDARGRPRYSTDDPSGGSVSVFARRGYDPNQIIRHGRAAGEAWVRTRAQVDAVVPDRYGGISNEGTLRVLEEHRRAYGRGRGDRGSGGPRPKRTFVTRGGFL